MIDFNEIKGISAEVINNVEKVIIGKAFEIRLTLLAVFSGGHILFEDVPGVGKTMLARAISSSLGCSFKRIQFTPDLLPSDITGVSIYNQNINKFEFRPGPVISNIVLADEINRATPKTQSSLLECMEEKQVTVDGITHRLTEPFLVIATQNSIEYEGTFPLPRAQLDRFAIKIRLGYPGQKAEEELLLKQQKKHPILDLEKVITPDKLLEVQEKVKDVYVSENIRKYIVSIVQKTRENLRFTLGASPRGSISLFKISQVYAAIEGRDYVIPDDIKKIVIPCLAHRIIPKYEFENKSMENIFFELLDEIEVPVV
ncbi:MAG TPA: MoxR family ATPase [Candidatus Eremiobacteraeota bacterium]|nr:MAG: ATPase RavA [bacterium ADurb.Bin363]HPZ09223.1 MoxR family ATPase [Candidatus Eremiobacteraeota bacterium]